MRPTGATKKLKTTLLQAKAREEDSRAETPQETDTYDNRRQTRVVTGDRQTATAEETAARGVVGMGAKFKKERNKRGQRGIASGNSKELLSSKA